jgi:hypothetical protein
MVRDASKRVYVVNLPRVVALQSLGRGPSRGTSARVERVSAESAILKLSQPKIGQQGAPLVTDKHVVLLLR